LHQIAQLLVICGTGPAHGLLGLEILYFLIQPAYLIGDRGRTLAARYGIPPDAPLSRRFAIDRYLAFARRHAGGGNCVRGNASTRDRFRARTPSALIVFWILARRIERHRSIAIVER